MTSPCTVSWVADPVFDVSVEGGVTSGTPFNLELLEGKTIVITVRNRASQPQEKKYTLRLKGHDGLPLLESIVLAGSKSLEKEEMKQALKEETAPEVKVPGKSFRMEFFMEYDPTNERKIAMKKNNEASYGADQVYDSNEGYQVTMPEETEVAELPITLKITVSQKGKSRNYFIKLKY